MSVLFAASPTRSLSSQVLSTPVKDPEAGQRRKHGEIYSGEDLSYSKQKGMKLYRDDKWLRVSQKIKMIFLGCNQTDKCSPMRIAYWKELFPIAIGEMKLHQYPNKDIESRWKKSTLTISYHEFVKRIMLSGNHSIQENNVIYFNPLELEGFKVSLDKGKIVKPEGCFKEKRYIYVYTKERDLLVAQKFKTQMGRIQHSSLSGGAPVKSAGWLTFDKDGNLTEISNFTGHYLISRGQVDDLLSYLKENGVKLGMVSIVFSPNGTVEDHSKFTLEQWQGQG